MGNNESSPRGGIDKHVFENPEQLKDGILKQISFEMQNTQRHLECSKHILEKNAYATHKRQIDELKIKFIEFYKFTQINDGMIKRLSTTNAELERTLSEYKKELLKYESEKEELKENLNKKEQDLLSRCSRVQQDLSTETSTTKKLKEDIKEYKNKCEDYERQIKNLESNVATAKRELFIEMQCRQKAEIALKAKQRQDDLFNKHATNLKDLQERLTQNKQCLERERMINQEGSFKLQAVTQYCENLNRQLEQKEAQQQEDIDHLKKKINDLENQLNKTKINLAKSRRDTRLSEELRKKTQISLEEKQKELDDYSNQLEILKTCCVQTFDKMYKVEDEKETDKLFFDFISNYQEKSNSASNQKSQETQDSLKEEIQKYEQKIQELKDELRSSDMKFQCEERLKKEIQGKLFLVERNFNSLRTFCSKELQDLKFYLKNEKIEQRLENDTQQQSDDLITLETEVIQSNKLLPSIDEKQERIEVSQENFCANQRNEMNQLHKEFQSVFSS
ncbi:hypothetical protein ILUMI_10907 [Ignelater luminosus]|uniref:Uncharacterized protein n=1 Tax=Ignelater luminosus TaxID=2038154 RepID=A0A8K0CX91_IGNLU|nr:hypothetical protein ILUMI_10907 [Ignelater luminosus]